MAATSVPTHVTVDQVNLLVADPELGRGIPAAELDYATRVLVARPLRLPRGPFEPTGTMLVLDGVVTREVVLADRRCAEIVGPGDVIRAARPSDSLLPHDVEWRADAPAVVVELDDRFAAAARRWPSLAETVQERLLEQAERLAVRTAIAQLGRVELRILALLWHLADRWGRVGPTGVTVPLKLTHDALGRLVGAQRPTVTLALAVLAEQGVVERTTAGGWLLAPGSRAELDPQPAAPALRLAG